MLSDLLPMGKLGPHEDPPGHLTLGLILPWVRAVDGNEVWVKIIHEDDQFIQAVQPREFKLDQGTLEPWGEYWSCGPVPIQGPDPEGSHWGQPGRYVYRYVIHNPKGEFLDWIVDPFAREFGVGKLSAFTLGYKYDTEENPFPWGPEEAAWRTPSLEDLVFYEVNVAELGGNLRRTGHLLDYISDLGANAIEVMPLSNVASSVDWGYMPIGYFGVDERMGKRSAFQRLVAEAHKRRIAVIADVVYAHTGADFGYCDAYKRLGYHENPFMGAFAQDGFGGSSQSTDYNRQLTRDYFYSVNHHWLEVYHVDGFRYDYVPGYWDTRKRPGPGYDNLVYQTYQLAKSKATRGIKYWTRFGDGTGPLNLVQCAEYLDDPKLVLRETYSNCTWQDDTRGAAHDIAVKGDRGPIDKLGLSLGLFEYTSSETMNGDVIPKTALQYIENHDHARFLCNFGTRNQDDARNPLFEEGKRENWYMVQPYLIALLLGKGIPMLWQGQEFGENYWVPDSGSGRVGFLRPLRWDYFYDEAGKGLIRLTRRLLSIRKSRDHIRHGGHFFYNDWDNYQRRGVLIYSRSQDAAFTLVAVNTGPEDLNNVPFEFPVAGDYVEELHGGDLNLKNVSTKQRMELKLPRYYGRVWTTIGQ